MGYLERSPGYETYQTISPDGTSTPTQAPFLAENLTGAIDGTVSSIMVTAPGYYWVNGGCGATVDCGFNLAPFAAGATRISMGRALGQFAAFGMGGGTALGALYTGIAGAPTAIAVVRASARARLITRMLAKGVDASYGELTNQLAEQQIISDAEISFMESRESLSDISSATEIATPEVTGPILPWGP